MALEGKAILITGGSRGLGRALAEAVGRRGAKVALVARDGESLSRTASELRARGVDAHGIAADIADKDAIYAIAGQAAALIGPLDVLVHNASTLGPTPLRLLLDTDCETLERVLAVNLVGPFRLTKAIAGSMALRGAGLVLHISSDAATSAYPSWGAYGVSKAALDHLNRSFAVELEGTGVRFVSIDPGEMDTVMHAEAMPDADRASLARPEAVAERIAALIADPERVPSGARVAATEIAP